MRRKLLVVAVVLAAFSAFVSGPALAVDGGSGSGTVSATVGAESGVFGTRSITSVTPGAMTLQSGTSTMTGSVAVVVTELARTGTAEWSVTAVLTDLSDGATPTPNTISNGQVTISGAAPTFVNPGVTGTAGAGGALSGTATLYTVTGESPLGNYSSVYTSSHTLTLTIPNGQKTGVYTGTLTVSLVQ